MSKLRRWVNALGLSAALVVCTLVVPVPSLAVEPIKVGMTMALTGGVAPIGKQLLAALEIWRDDVNAKGGLLGRQLSLSITTIRAIRPTFRGFIPS